MDAGDDEVLCERRGEAGLITLNRPKALNALTRRIPVLVPSGVRPLYPAGEPQAPRPARLTRRSERMVNRPSAREGRMDAGDDEVLCERRGEAGLITLNFRFSFRPGSARSIRPGSPRLPGRPGSREEASVRVAPGSLGLPGRIERADPGRNENRNAPGRHPR
jgi:hypothetical protein